jgi:hypothetical protein
VILQPGECGHTRVSASENGTPYGARRCLDCGKLLPPGPPHPPRRTGWRSGPAPPGGRIVSIPEALAGGYPILDPLGNRLHYPGEPQYEAWREEHRKNPNLG